ncbi:MAG: hypothetical protein A2Y62_07150 [Candidatus Fischerbacteria bacterium RBG_13_37_8]|uniref:Uncharacterized protein n=1 Tax=Candidatus Fischerbacteria bacterium RBG_13_37_8 TaxID=1817863 RepID=A0A1F5VUT7_9BACT|nr:MAG: hypothetical protein A2Y62_07150 [Candidatus Fischerbacteria bacterium RBG_13_37_8]
MKLCSIARCMNTKGTPKSRYKRLDRFLLKAPFEIAEVTKAFLGMIPYEKIGGLVPVLIDQTDVSGVQVIAASIPSQGRALPLAFTTFEKEKEAKKA